MRILRLLAAVVAIGLATIAASGCRASAPAATLQSDVLAPSSVNPAPKAVVELFPTDIMAGQVGAYSGPRDHDPSDEAPYDLVSGHANFGVGAATTPFVEAKLPANGLLARRKEVKAALWKALKEQAGDPNDYPISWSDLTFVTPVEDARTTRLGTGYIRQNFYFDDPLFGMKVSGLIMVPKGLTALHGAPAVLYNHFHGGLHYIGTQEVDSSWQFPPHGSFGDHLIDEGFIVLAIDTVGFNWRRIGHDTRPQTGNVADDNWDELAATQQFATQEFKGSKGRSRYAVRTFDDILALRLLARHPLVNPAKISTMGMSMGCVRSWTLGALVGDELASVVALGTFPRWQDLVTANRLKAHRNAHFFTGQISDMHLDTESYVLAASETNVFAIMGDSDQDPQDGQPRPSSPDPSSPGWPTIFDYGNYVSQTLNDKEFKAMGITGLGHTWTGDLAESAVQFMKKHSQ